MGQRLGSFLRKRHFYGNSLIVSFLQRVSPGISVVLDNIPSNHETGVSSSHPEEMALSPLRRHDEVAAQGPLVPVYSI